WGVAGERARVDPSRRVLRGARGAGGCVAGGRDGRARFLPGSSARRSRLVPGRSRQPRRLRTPAREGAAAARALRPAASWRRGSGAARPAPSGRRDGRGRIARARAAVSLVHARAAPTLNWVGLNPPPSCSTIRLDRARMGDAAGTNAQILRLPGGRAAPQRRRREWPLLVQADSLERAVEADAQ